MDLSGSDIANQVIATIVAAAILAIISVLIKRYSKVELNWSIVFLLLGQALLVVLVGQALLLGSRELQSLARNVNEQNNAISLLTEYSKPRAPTSTQETVANWIAASPLDLSPLDPRRTDGLSFEFGGKLDADEFEDTGSISLFVYAYAGHPDGLIAIEAIPPTSAGCVPRSKGKALGLLSELGVLPENTEVRMSSNKESSNLRLVRWIDANSQRSAAYFVEELAELAGVANAIRYALVGRLTQC